MIDAINTEETLIDRAYELGLRGVAITDHESVSGHVKALNYYNKKYKDKKDEFKLILGNEIYLTRSGLNSDTHQKGEKFYHLLLLAKDSIGHKQLRELSTRAWGRSYYKNMMRTPTFQEDLIDVIQNDPGHVMCTTACLGGYPGSMFLMNELDAIQPFLDSMVAIFGYENFFVELQPSRQKDQIDFNKHMIVNFWDDYNFVFTTDSHYLKKEDQEVHRWFLQSKSGADRDVDHYYETAYLMDWEELKSFFDWYISMPKIEVMRNNTNKIWEMVEEYDLNHGQIVPKIKYEDRFDKHKILTIAKLFQENGLENYTYLQKFINPEYEADGYLMNLILEGYYDKIYTLQTNAAKKDISIKERMERLDYELEQIYETSVNIKQSLSDYFITMAKMIEIIWDKADSIVGPGRGSAAGFLVNYLIGITQIDPQTQMLYLPPWRFIHKDRPGLPDIDIDTESTKRTKIFNKIREYFNEIGADVINVCTFGTEGSKSAIRTAGRGVEIDDSTVSYLTSMVPNERGFDLTLSQCYYGDDTHNPIKEFVSEMDNHPKLKKLAFAIEGLITRLGAHAAGVLILEGSPAEHNSIMKTNKGIVVSAYNLEDSEQMGGLKYDMLTVAALDKIHATMNYMLEDREITWEGTLRDTYNKYLLPAVLEYDDIRMWKKLWEGEVIDAFQFDTMVGSQAIKLIKPVSIAELAIANSIMRLMAQDNMELPLDTFVKYKKNLNEWYHEMSLYGLNREHVDILEPHLKVLYGVADSQEAAMMLVMDEKITNFSLNEANSLRKAIAKKDFKVLQKTKEMYYQKGQELGTDMFLLDYVWNVQIGRQIGYSFSILHTMAYSTITLQQMNLVHKWNPIYWKTACLSVNAGAINEEDYYNLVEEGIIELSDEDDVRSTKKIQYGKVASAIGDMRGTIEVKQPDINRSRMGFTPDAEENTILYGIKGITRIGDHIIQEIILNRPYTSLQDFVNKMKTSDEKKLISKDKVVNLIKAGAFDRIEKRPRAEILKDYITNIAETKQKLTLQNFMMLIKSGLVPDNLTEEIKCYNFTKYIRKSRYEKYYALDDIAKDYILERFPGDKIKTIKHKDGFEIEAISESWWDAIYNAFMNNVRTWIRNSHEELLSKLNEGIFSEEYQKYARGTILDWELQSLNFFYSGHPLDGIEIPIETISYNDIREGEIVGHFMIKGKTIPKLRLHTIVGTVIDKDKQKSIVTLATKDAVVDVKLYKQQFAKYTHESNLDEDDENYKPNEENFFEKGTHLAITGVKRGDMFLPKVYKQTGLQEILKITLKDGKFHSFKAKA
jgi:DNA polymerase III subunit alpha